VRIALIGPAVPDQGGAARHTTELAYRLAAAGHNVVIESWRAPGPAAANPADPVQYPRTHRRLAWYRPDGWIAAGRRLRSADLVVFALESQAQVPSYLSVLTALALHPDHPRTALICHPALPDAEQKQSLTRILLARAGTVIVHSAAQAAQVRTLAAEVPIIIARMPPHQREGPEPEPYWPAYLHALGVLIVGAVVPVVRRSPPAH